jgi:hypothetical protein
MTSLTGSGRRTRPGTLPALHPGPAWGLGVGGGGIVHRKGGVTPTDNHGVPHGEILKDQH